MSGHQDADGAAGALRERLEAVTRERDEAEGELRTVRGERAGLARLYAAADAALQGLRLEVAQQAATIHALRQDIEQLRACLAEAAPGPSGEGGR